MKRPHESDLMGLDINAYGQLCPERRLSHAQPQEPGGTDTTALCIAVFVGVMSVVAVIAEALQWI